MKYLCTIFFVLIQIAYAQELNYGNIRGLIIDGETQEPLKLVNVFISNSSVGTATDKSGYFELRNIPYGKFEIIASIIGYKIGKVKLEIVNAENVANFKLIKKPLLFPEINVTGIDIKKRKRYLRIFRKNLLGTSQNGKKTIIKNEEIIRFDYAESGVLRAVADEPLEIINKSLGYNIKYILTDFELTSDYIRYSGYPFFTELESKSTKKIEKWKINRMKTFNGSLRHFLKTICNNYQKTVGDTSAREIVFDHSDINELGTKVLYGNDSHIEDEGFYTTQIDHPKSKLNRRLININRFLSATDNPQEMYFKFDGYLEVHYRKDYFPFTYQIGLNKNYSWITLAQDSTIIDVNGRYYDKYAIKTDGVWGLERVGDMLPFDYETD